MPTSPATYILPIRRERTPAGDDLTEYLRWVASVMPVLIVDGSPAPVFAAHKARWEPFATHRAVDADFAVPNGKVAGVLTGLRHAGHEKLVIADDDVRYDEASLAALLRALDDAHVVRPQNYFQPLPWHARWDTGRILVNRALDGDWPGTLAVRRSAMRATGGYAGDVLFENLELVRTVVAAGGRQEVARDIFVQRVPPDSAHFWSQRVRQAYDELARPLRLGVQLAILPLLGIAASMRAGAPLTLAIALVVGVAEWGRRRQGGAQVFPPSASLMAPVWLLERAVTSWLAVATRVFRGGVGYAGARITRAASAPRELARLHGGAITPPLQPAGRAIPRRSA